MKLFWSEAERPGGTSLSGVVILNDAGHIRKDVQDVGAIQVALQAIATKRLCEISGEIKADIVYRCGRCLAEVPNHLQAPFREVFSRLPLTKEQEEEDVVYWENDEILLDPFVEQAVILALQGQPLCREDCVGLCATCGVNLNMETCGCSDRRVDPRLETLSQLLRTMEEDS